MGIISKIKSLFAKSQEEPKQAVLSEEKPKSIEIITDEETNEQEQKQESEQTTLRDAFKAKYPQYADHILKMFQAANLCEPTWENLTKVRLQKFIDYMNERLSPNSVHQYCTKLKSVLNLYSDEVSLPRGYAKVLTPRKCASTAVFLTEEEIDRLIDYTPKNQNEEFVRDLFVICCFCGTRHSDALNLNESNFVGDNLQYVSVKTKIHTVVPLKPIVKEYILNHPKIEIEDSTYNRIIRRICKKCGITEKVKVFKAGEEQEGEKWQYISSHTARRSFASNLYLRGVDLYSISKMIGHSDVKTTQNYVKADLRTNSEELMGYFK